MKVSELGRAADAKFPPTTLEPGQDPNDSVTVIDVKRKLLEPVLPSKSEIGLLAHVRNPMDLEGNTMGTELATVLCNRLPQPGGTSTAYLVSVEGRYLQGSDAFDFDGAGPDHLIRLVCLKSWRFACTDPDQSFTQLLLKVNHAPSTPRLPDSGDAGADVYLRMGYVPIPHALRQGDRTVSWYHGPLSPGDVRERVTRPARTGDELVRYEARTGMFDVSYAAAWQLGRMLTLEDQAVAPALYQWRRAAGLELRQAKQRIAHLPFRAARTRVERPQVVQDWFESLCILRGVPFENLVPDERLLPAESLRSSVVSGWPDLIVDGYASIITDTAFQRTAEPKMDMLRMDRLSANVLICLFDGAVKTVDMPKDDRPGFYKTLRDRSTGEEIPEREVAVPWKDEGKGVIDISRLAETMQSFRSLSSFTSAAFALQMIEGVQKVRVSQEA